MSPPGESAGPTAEEHRGLHEVSVKYAIFLRWYEVCSTGRAPAGEFGFQDLPLMMLPKPQLGPEPHGTLKIHNSAQFTGFC